MAQRPIPPEKEVKKLLSSLIISSAKGITINNLAYDYRNSVGEDVPFTQYGFGSFEDYLRSIPDVCVVHGYGTRALVEAVITQNVQHINKMINNQRKPKANSKRRPVIQRARGIITAPPPPPLLSLPVMRPLRNGIPPADYYLEMKVKKQSFKPKTAMNTYQPRQYDSNFRNPQTMEPASSNQYNTHTIQSTHQNQFRNVHTVPDAPYHIQPSTSSGEAKALSTTSFKTDDYLDDHYLSDEIYYSDDDDDISKYMNVSDKSDSREMQDLATSENVEYESSRVNQHVKNNLKLLINENSGGIWCAKLPKLYRERFREELDTFGYQSVSEMCQHLEDIFYIIRPGKTDWKIFDRTKPEPKATDIEEWCNIIKSYKHERNEQPEEPFPKNIIEKRPRQIKYPEDVMTLDDDIQYEWIDNEDQMGNGFIPLIISEVYDPSKFWIQLKSKYAQLDSLMDQLQSFYGQFASIYKMTIENSSEGLLCAALFLNEFHRAIILKKYSINNTARLYYFDYGTVAVVNYSKIFFLHNQFGTLPRQAIRGRLSNIIPKDQNTMWTRDAANRFLELIQSRTLVGYLADIDYEEYILQLIITDVTDPKVDIHINDLLVDEEYAVFGNKAEICATSSATIPDVHLYPTFSQIENGDCPTVTELNTVHNLGLKLEQIFSNFFAKSYTDPDNLYNSTDNEVYESENTEVQTSDKNEDETSNVNKTIESYEANIVTESCNESLKTEICRENERDEIHSDTTPQLKNNDNTTEVASNIPTLQTISTEQSIPHAMIEQQSVETQKIIKPPPGFERFHPNPQSVGMLNITHNTNYYTGNPLECRQMYYPNVNQPQTLHFAQLNAIQGYVQTMQQIQKRKESLDAIKLINDCAILRTLGNDSLHHNYQMKLRNDYIENMNILNMPGFPGVNINEPPGYMSQFSAVPQQPQKGTEEWNNVQQCPSPDSADRKSPELEITDCYNLSKIRDTLTPSPEHIEHSTPKKENNPISGVQLESEKIHKDSYVFAMNLREKRVHVIKLDKEFYLSTQEIISKIMGSSDLYFAWLKQKNLQVTHFPCKVINLLNFEEVYNEITKYNVPGVAKANNLGCNVRLTLLSELPRLVELYGDKSLIQEIKNISANMIHMN